MGEYKLSASLEEHDDDVGESLLNSIPLNWRMTFT